MLRNPYNVRIGSSGRWYLRPVLVFLFCVLTVRADAGIEIVTHESTYLPGTTVQRTGKMFVEGDRLRVKVGEMTIADIAESFIYRADLETLWKLDHQARRYIEINRNTLEELARHMRAARRQMDAALERMDEEQRERVERMMRDRAPHVDREQKRTVRRTDDRDTVNGYPCVRYEVVSDDTVLRELWVTPWDELGMDAYHFRVLNKMADFQKQMVEALSEGPVGLQQVEEEVFTDFEAVDGFPIQVRHYEDGDLARDITFVSIERTDIDPDRFTVPNHYTRQDPFQPGRLPPPRFVEP